MDYASSSRGSAVPERDLPTRARRDRTRHVRAVLDCDLTSRQFDSVGHKSSPVILSELEGRLFRPRSGARSVGRRPSSVFVGKIPRANAVLAFIQTQTDREVQPFVPLTPLVPAKSDSTVESRPTPAPDYKSLLKYFAVRLCVVVTVAVILLGAFELFSYLYLPAAQEAIEPAFIIAEDGNAVEREYVREREQANKVLYHQYVLWRHAPYQGTMLAIDQDGVRRTLHTQCDSTTFTIWMFGDSVMWSAGARD